MGAPRGIAGAVTEAVGGNPIMQASSQMQMPSVQQGYQPPTPMFTGQNSNMFQQMFQPQQAMGGKGGSTQAPSGTLGGTSFKPASMSVTKNNVATQAPIQTAPLAQSDRNGGNHDVGFGGDTGYSGGMNAGDFSGGYGAGFGPADLGAFGYGEAGAFGTGGSDGGDSGGKSGGTGEGSNGNAGNGRD